MEESVESAFNGFNGVGMPTASSNSTTTDTS